MYLEFRSNIGFEDYGDIISKNNQDTNAKVTFAHYIQKYPHPHQNRKSMMRFLTSIRLSIDHPMTATNRRHVLFLPP